jgi:hypothetical protein
MTERKTTDDLINELEQGLCPVSTMACPFHRGAVWFFTGLVFVVILGALLEFRMDLKDKITDIKFISEIGLILAMGFSAAYASAWLSLPDGSLKKSVIIIPYVLIFIAGVLMVQEIFYHGFILQKVHIHHCVIDASVMGTVPLMLMVWMMRQGAPVYPVLAALTNMIFAGSIGYLGLRLTCGSDEMGHMCTYHILPFIFFGLILGLLARRLYRW